jgi:glycosyltransferase involved in cell wall biosynthesis
VAAFTAELSRVSPDREIVALHPAGPVPKHSYEVHHRIRSDERDDYARTALTLDHCADVVSLQFDTAGWGGQDGEYVLDFAAGLKIPAIATLHSIRRRPTAHQRDVVAELTTRVHHSVVMSQAAFTALVDEYGVDAARVDVIPYGVPDLPILGSEAVKPLVDLAGHTVILGAGLLAPNKGFERVIDVLPTVVAAHPDVVFVVLGATHPDEKRDHGETYRESLVARARSLGVEASVRFVDQFVGRVELTRWLQAADVMVTPYLDLGSTLAGTLAHGMAAGRAVVSTRYPYAVELLAGSRGVLVSSTSAALVEGLLALLGNDRRRAAMGARAHAYARPMAWDRVGADYQRLFNSLMHPPVDTATYGGRPLTPPSEVRASHPY